MGVIDVINNVPFGEIAKQDDSVKWMQFSVKWILECDLDVRQTSTASICSHRHRTTTTKLDWWHVDAIRKGKCITKKRINRWHE